MRLAFASLGLLLLCLPARADLDAARRSLRRDLLDTARRQLAPDRQSSQAGVRFEAEALRLRCEFRDGDAGQVVKDMHALERQPRKQLPLRALRQLLLLQDEVEGREADRPGAEARLRQAADWSVTLEERLEVTVRLAELLRQNGRAAEGLELLRQVAAQTPEAAAVDPSLMGWLECCRARLEREAGQPAQAELSLLAADQWFRQGADASGQAASLQLRAELSNNNDQQGVLLEQALQRLGSPELAARRLDIFSALSQRRSLTNANHSDELLTRLDAQRPQLRPWMQLRCFVLRTVVAARVDLPADAARQAVAELRSHPPAGLNQQVELLALAETGRIERQANHDAAAESAISRALALSNQLHLVRQDVLSPMASAASLGIDLAAMRTRRGDLAGAAAAAREAGQAAARDGQPWLVLTVLQSQLGAELELGLIEQARLSFSALLDQAAASTLPERRGVAYFLAFSALLGSIQDPLGVAEPTPLRIPSGTPASALLQALRDDPELNHRSLSALRDWVELARRRHASNDGATASTVYAVVLGCEGRPLEAVDVYRQALQASRDQPTSRANLAYLLGRELHGLGRDAEALGSFDEAIAQSANHSPRWAQAWYVLMRAGLLRDMGQLAEARQAADRAVELTSDQPNSYRVQMLLARSRLALRAHDGAAALRDARQAHELTKDGTNLSLFAESCCQLALCEPSRRDEWLTAAGARVRERGLPPQVAFWLNRLAEAWEQGGDPRAALSCCEAGLEWLAARKQSLSPAAQAQLITTAHHLLHRAVRLVQARNEPQASAHVLELARELEQAPVQGPGLDDLRSQLSSLEHQLTSAHQASDEALRAQVASTRAEFLAQLNRLRSESPGFDDAVAAQGGELLALAPALPPRTLVLQPYASADTLYLQTVTRDGLQMRAVTLERGRLEQLITLWRSALERPHNLTEPERAAQQELSALLLGPLRDSLANVDAIWMVPAGPFWGLPLSTLVDEQGRYALERWRISWLTPADLLTLQRPPQRASSHLVALAGGNLEGGAAEVQALAQLTADAEVVPAHQATHERLALLCRHAAMLHLATHSQALPGNPNQSFLQLADGPLSLAQVYALELPAGALVTLSSCETALPQDNPGRELVALSSGFRAAGAASVVASLWKVDDAATALLFPTMYRELLAGRSRAESLRTAQLQLLHDPDTAAPCYWAAWTLLGDPR